MTKLHVFRSEAGGYGFTRTKDETALPSNLAPWTWWKEIRFDANKPLIGASRTSLEIAQIIEREGYYLEGSDASLQLD